MPLDRARAQEEPAGDLGIRVALSRQLRDLDLLRCQLVAGLRSAFAHRRAGRFELSAGTLRERAHADRRQHAMRRPEVLAGIDAPAFAAQPFAVEQMGAGQLRRDAAAAEPIDRLLVEPLLSGSWRHQRACARLDAERTLGRRRAGALAEAF